MKRYLLVLMLWATGAAGETPMSGEAFDAYTLGKTLTYIEDGRAYGIEEYRPGRQVRWAFDGDQCRDGYWWEPEAGLICFSYDNDPDAPQCWNFYESTNGLRAVFAEDGPGRELYEARPSHQPLICLGPEIGV
ncbi:MAG: hypothetical protein ACU0CA_12880 [Paracoccaceae bacterium]